MARGAKLTSGPTAFILALTSSQPLTSLLYKLLRNIHFDSRLGDDKRLIKQVSQVRLVNARKRGRPGRGQLKRVDVSDSISENIGTGPAALQRCETARRNPFSAARPAVSRSGAGQREEAEIVIRYSLYAVHCPHRPASHCPQTAPHAEHGLNITLSAEQNYL